MSDLKEALQEIQGVGEATAESVIEILEEQSTDVESPLLERAIREANNGNDRKAAIFLTRYSKD